MDDKEYRILKKKFSALIRSNGVEERYIEDFVQECIIRYWLKPSQKKPHIVIDVLRDITGRKGSKNYETRRNLTINSYSIIGEKNFKGSYEITIPELPENFIPKTRGSWPVTLWRIMKLLSKGKSQADIARSLKCTEANISSTIKLHRKKLQKRYHWCMKPRLYKWIAKTYKITDKKEIEKQFHKLKRERYKKAGRLVVSKEYERLKRKRHRENPELYAVPWEQKNREKYLKYQREYNRKRRKTRQKKCIKVA